MVPHPTGGYYAYLAYLAQKPSRSPTESPWLDSVLECWTAPLLSPGTLKTQPISEKETLEFECT